MSFPLSISDRLNQVNEKMYDIQFAERQIRLLEQERENIIDDLDRLGYQNESLEQELDNIIEEIKDFRNQLSGMESIEQLNEIKTELLNQTLTNFNFYDIRLYLDDEVINTKTKEFQQLPNVIIDNYRFYMSYIQKIFRENMKTKLIFDRIGEAKFSIKQNINDIIQEWIDSKYLRDDPRIDFIYNFNLDKVIARISKTSFKLFYNFIELYQSFYLYSWYKMYFNYDTNILISNVDWFVDDIYRKMINLFNIDIREFDWEQEKINIIKNLNEWYQSSINIEIYWATFANDILINLNNDVIVDDLINNLGYNNFDFYNKLKESLFDEWNNIYFYQLDDIVDFTFLKSLVNVYRGTNILESIQSIDRILPEYNIGRKEKTINIEDFISVLLTKIANINVDTEMIINNNFKICNQDTPICKSDIIVTPSKYILNYCFNPDAILDETQFLANINKFYTEGGQYPTYKTNFIELNIQDIINESYNSLDCMGKNLPNYFIFNIDNYRDYNDKRLMVMLKMNNSEMINIGEEEYELISCSLFKPNPGIKVPHYITCIKNRGLWYLLDDNIIKPLSNNIRMEDNIELLRDATLFIYKKKNIDIAEYDIRTLKNLNETCYVNSSLQLLMPTNLFELLDSCIMQMDPNWLNINKSVFRRRIESYLKKDNIDEILSNREDLRPIAFNHTINNSFEDIIKKYPIIINSFEFVEYMKSQIFDIIQENQKIEEYQIAKSTITDIINNKYTNTVNLNIAKRYIMRDMQIIKNNWPRVNTPGGNFIYNIDEYNFATIIDRISNDRYRYWYNMINYFTDRLAYSLVILNDISELDLEPIIVANENIMNDNFIVLRTKKNFIKIFYDDLITQLYMEWDRLLDNETVNNIDNDSIFESLITLYKGNNIIGSLSNIMRLSSEYKGLVNVKGRELTVENFINRLFDDLIDNTIYQSVLNYFTRFRNNNYIVPYINYLNGTLPLIDLFTLEDYNVLYNGIYPSNINERQQLLNIFTEYELTLILQRNIELNNDILTRMIFAFRIKNNYPFRLFRHTPFDLERLALTLSTDERFETKDYLLLYLDNGINFSYNIDGIADITIVDEGARQNYERIIIRNEEYKLISFNVNLYDPVGVVGHTIAYVNLRNQWYNIDDNNILKKVDSIEEPIKKAEFYVYKRVDFEMPYDEPEPIKIINFNSNCYMNVAIQLLFPTIFFPLIEDIYDTENNPQDVEY